MMLLPCASICPVSTQAPATSTGRPTWAVRPGRVRASRKACSRSVAKSLWSATNTLVCTAFCWCDLQRRHQACQNEVAVDLRQRRPSVDQISRIGMDTSKHIFQLHGVNTAEEPVLRKKLRRKEMFAFLEKLAPTVIAIEACG